MIRLLRACAIALALVLAPSCGFPTVDPTDRQERIARTFLEDLIAGDRQGVQEVLDPRVWIHMDGQFLMLDRWLGRAPRPLTLVSTLEHTIMSPGEGNIPVTTLAFETPANGASMIANRPDQGPRAQWLVAEASLQQRGSELVVVNWSILPMANRPSEVGDFNFESRSWQHYLWLALAIASPVTCVVAVALMWIGPRFNLRWLWTIGALFGVGRFSLDWASGIINFQPLWINVLGAGFYKLAPLAPVIVFFGVPVVAIVYLVWKRPKVLAAARDPAEVF